MEKFKYPDEYNVIERIFPQHFIDDAVNYQRNLPDNLKLPENEYHKEHVNSRELNTLPLTQYTETGQSLAYQMQHANDPDAPVMGIDAFRHMLWQST